MLNTRIIVINPTAVIAKGSDFCLTIDRTDKINAIIIKNILTATNAVFECQINNTEMAAIIKTTANAKRDGLLLKCSDNNFILMI